ncbi:hypothetical protein JOM56_013005 [Amanita muscaria]
MYRLYQHYYPTSYLNCACRFFVSDQITPPRNRMSSLTSLVSQILSLPLLNRHREHEKQPVIRMNISYVRAFSCVVSTVCVTEISAGVVVPRVVLVLQLLGLMTLVAVVVMVGRRRRLLLNVARIIRRVQKEAWFTYQFLLSGSLRDASFNPPCRLQLDPLLC